VVRTVVAVVSSLVVVVVAALVGLFLWLRTYTPLAATPPVTPGPGLGADVEPTFGSGGKPVFIPAYKPGRNFETTFTLHNTGRFAITVTGLAGPASGALAPVAIARNVRLDPHETALLDVAWRLDCRHAPGEVAADHVRLRYRYLSLFTRTASVELPFAVTLRCSGGPPASP
jgi:hypothetical protein